MSILFKQGEGGLSHERVFCLQVFTRRAVARNLLFDDGMQSVSFCSNGFGRHLSDGKLLAIDFGDDNSSFIYKIDVDSGNATRLTDAKVGRESSPAFSPDGKRISYSYSPGKGQPSSIVIENVDGSNRQSWSSSGGNDYWPEFSLDGKTIIFARSAYYGNYSPIAQPHPHSWDVYAGDSNGTNLRRLTHEEFYIASPLLRLR